MAVNSIKKIEFKWSSSGGQSEKADFAPACFNFEQFKKLPLQTSYVLTALLLQVGR